MKKLILNKYFLLLLRIILSLIFILAAIEKISNPAAFSESIANYKLFPSIMINFSAIIIPWIELITGVLLLFGISVKENAAIITVLLNIFTLAVIISLFRGLNIECGCFGTALGEKVGLRKVMENILLIICGLLLIMAKDSSFASLIQHEKPSAG
jgi:uncharacterized membrane protein YphA (DoxX/SURF4 family)